VPRTGDGAKRAPKAKLDLYALHRDEYVAPRSPVLVDIGPAQYVAIAGRGEPGGAEFSDAVSALYNVAFTVKMARKFAGSDYAVSKLEGLWWGSRPGADFMAEPRQRWNWQLMIRVPDFVAADEVADASSRLIERGKPQSVTRVRLEPLTEGRCVQMLHVGPYTAEPASVERMRAFAEERGLGFRGRHHEIYLSDPRRVAAERLRTILRMPVG
jgi:hypothetical protein